MNRPQHPALGLLPTFPPMGGVKLHHFDPLYPCRCPASLARVNEVDFSEPAHVPNVAVNYGTESNGLAQTKR